MVTGVLSGTGGNPSGMDPALAHRGGPHAQHKLLHALALALCTVAVFSPILVLYNLPFGTKLALRMGCAVLIQISGTPGSF